MRAGWLAYAVISIAFLVTVLVAPGPPSKVLQVALMPPLVLVLLGRLRTPGSTGAAGRPNPARLARWAVAALFFSWLGDTVPNFAPDPDLALIAMFCGAQICYVVGFWPFRGLSVLFRRRGWLLAYLAGAAAVVAAIWPHAGVLRPAVAVYGVLLVAMATTATGLGRLGTLGALAFLVSDSMIGLGIFGVTITPAVVSMALYILAQALLVRAVVTRGN